MITQEKLKSYLKYYPDTGDFVWLKNRQKYLIGGEAGSVSDQGYIRIMVEQKSYRAHRLAWLYVYGYMPEDPIDHINNVRIDNRICNLRIATVQNNVRNSVVRRAKKSGLLKGVSYYKERKDKFVAQIRIAGKQHKLGIFDSEQAAHIAYCEKAKQYFGEYANFGVNNHGTLTSAVSAI
jgi:hypothetical protein